MYSVREAADKLEISDSHCRRLLEAGQIEGKKLGHDWVVLSLDYSRKRKPKGGNTMPRVRITFDFTIGVGKKAARHREEGLAVQLLEGRAMTMRELIEELTFGGKMSRSFAERLIRGAIVAGVLLAFPP